jgi:hypothetical protein
MAGFIGGTPGDFSGTTWVTVVAAPASGKQRQVLAVHVSNLDSITHKFKLRKVVGASQYEMYAPKTVDAGLKGQLVDQSIVLDATNMSLEAALDEAISATQPKFDPAVFEVP